MNLDINRITGGGQKGEVVQDESPSVPTESGPHEPVPFLDGHTRYGDGRVTILDVTLLNERGEPTELLELHDPYTVRVVLRANANIERPAIGYSLCDFKGNQVVGGINSNFPEVETPAFEAGKVYQVDMSAINNLAQGGYTINIGVESIVQQNKVHQFLDVLVSARVFQSTFGARPENIFPAMVWQKVAFDIKAVGTPVAA
jgi:lipopolysaccharide transport system ATP-binding protein